MQEHEFIHSLMVVMNNLSVLIAASTDVTASGNYIITAHMSQAPKPFRDLVKHCINASQYEMTLYTYFELHPDRIPVFNRDTVRDENQG